MQSTTHEASHYTIFCVLLYSFHLIPMWTYKLITLYPRLWYYLSLFMLNTQFSKRHLPYHQVQSRPSSYRLQAERMGSSWESRGFWRTVALLYSSSLMVWQWQSSTHSAHCSINSYWLTSRYAHACVCVCNVQISTTEADNCFTHKLSRIISNWP
jgi:hypothetical protein